MCLCFCDCILVLLAVLFPPLPVWIKRGLCSADSLINILLCCLGYFPGLLHAWYIISRYPEDQYIIFDEELQIYILPNLNGQGYSSVPSPRVASPVNNNSNIVHNNNNNTDHYGSTNNNEPNEAPPAYDNVVSETAKNIH